MASYRVVQSTAAPLKILTGMRSSVGGLTVIITCLQADTVHVPHTHDAKAHLWLLIFQN